MGVGILTIQENAIICMRLVDGIVICELATSGEDNNEQEGV